MFKIINQSASGNEKIVELLIQNKANVNKKNKNGNTPLHLAAISGNSNDIWIHFTTDS